MKLVFGVLDQEYSDARGGGAETTGEVARILEDRYQVMETFYETRQDKISGWLAKDATNALRLMLAGKDMGKPRDAFYGATQKIESEFRAFLTRNEMGRLSFLSGAEAEYFRARGRAFGGAAAAGVSHRKKHPYAAQNKSRPVFVDTGLYRSSFRAWVE